MRLKLIIAVSFLLGIFAAIVALKGGDSSQYNFGESGR